MTAATVVASRVVEAQRIARDAERKALAKKKAQAAALKKAEAARKARERWMPAIAGAAFTSGYGWRWGRMHEGNDFGTGADISREELGNQFGVEEVSLLYEFGIDDEDVKYPPVASYRHLGQLADYYGTARSGTRPLQAFKKISIIEVKGYCYGWHFYQAADADLMVCSDDALFGHAAFRYAGWGPRLWTWIETMGYRKFCEMLFTGRPFTAQQMDSLGFVNSVVPRDRLEAEKKLAQIYRDCEFLECREVAAPAATEGLDFESVLSAINKQQK